MTKCKECKKEVSSKAKTCPHCGVSNLAVKSSEVVSGVIGLAFIGFLAYSFLGGSSDDKKSDSAPAAVAVQPPKKTDAECRQDLGCWAEKAFPEASYPCQKAVERLAKYSTKWIDGTFEMKFDHYRWLNQKSGSLVYVGDKAQFQNGFGAYQRMIYECAYDPTTKKVLNVVANPGQLPD